MILEYQLHKEIEKMMHERAQYEEKYTKGNQLIQVQENLNKRAIILKQQLLENPENQNLNLELLFCESEIERINEEQREFQEKYETPKQQIKKHEQIIDYNLQELNKYYQYLKELETDPILLKAMKNTIETLETNLIQLNKLKTITPRDEKNE